jgi:hypothetical protein
MKRVVLCSHNFGQLSTSFERLPRKCPRQNTNFLPGSRSGNGIDSNAASTDLLGQAGCLDAVAGIDSPGIAKLKLAREVLSLETPCNSASSARKWQNFDENFSPSCNTFKARLAEIFLVIQK